MASFKDWVRGLFGWPDDTEFYYVPGGMHSARASFSTPHTYAAKLKLILKNPAFLKVDCLQCDLFSLGKLYVYNGDKEVTGDQKTAILDRMANPNPFQTQRQFMWDAMFYLMLGNAYLYTDSRNPANDTAKLYWLDPSRMTWPPDFYKKSGKLILSRKSEQEILDSIIEYDQEDGSRMKIPVRDIVHITDLTNSLGDWYSGPSRVDALVKVIQNTEKILDAININSEYTGKFLVAGKNDPADIHKLPMEEAEKQSIEDKMNSKKKVHAVKSMIDIKRFVENMGSLKLPEHYESQYFIIGSMYGIPKDVLEAFQKSSTFENQEKAVGRHISYTLEPKGEDIMAAISRRFQLSDNRRVVISWDHLPFMQVFEKDRLAHKQMQITVFMNMLRMGIPIAEINEFLDTNFTDAKLEQPKPSGQANA
ncbi:MAG: hypothetical protein B7Z54_02565 [Sphingobacteriales bacterium 12-47-4]|nr:MAG: hypothetical protein B7Z54_02565 [Sphingobacteriales bacterium 12-47-4]